MQLLILFVGVMVFVFYQFTPPPLFFNERELAPGATQAAQAGELRALEAAHARRVRAQAARTVLDGYVAALEPSRATTAALAAAPARAARRGRARPDECAPSPGADRARAAARRDQGRRLRLHLLRDGEPARGLVGLLLAVILCAAMSSTASELTALGGCTRGRLLPAQLPPRRLATRTTCGSRSCSRPAGACWRSCSRPRRRCSTT